MAKSELLKTHARLPNRRWARLLLWARRVKLGGRVELLLSVLAVVSAVLTYGAMSREFDPLAVAEGRTLTILSVINIVLLCLLGAAVGRWIVKIWASRSANAPGARLHSRVTGYFIAIAIAPPIVMAIFAGVFLEFGLQTWFSGKVRTTLDNSLEVAEAYVREHRAEIGRDMIAISAAFEQLPASFQSDPLALQRVADTALSTRPLSEVLLIEELGGTGNIMAHASQSLTLRTSRVNRDLMERVRSGEFVTVVNTADNTVIAMRELSGFIRPTYLYIASDLDPQVINYLEAARAAVADFATLEGQGSAFRRQFNVVYIIVALLILLAAIWLGLWFSNRLVAPISQLVDAAQRVGEGDLEQHLPSPAGADEVGSLIRAFNTMTRQLAAQQNALLEANEEAEERRRFIEDVLAGVTAGVLGIAKDGVIFLPNHSAERLLGFAYGELLGKSVGDVVPAFAPLIDDARSSQRGTVQAQIQHSVGEELRTFLVRATVGRLDDGDIDGYVITFDDLTDQLADQRTAAWADVARRIAHEIKNPLTPIQLSAERLKRRYKDIDTADEIFSKCTNTIIRQVGDMRRMVDEFSSFARMPAPVFKVSDLVDALRQTVFLQEVANPDIRYEISAPNAPVEVFADSRLLGQALTNLVKNASEAVTARLENDDQPNAEPGWVRVSLAQREDEVTLTIEDNGIGLPAEQKERLMEPYVTTRKKGTGLGLAIVRRIIEEHAGRVRLMDRRGGGAKAVIHLSIQALSARAQQQDSPPEMGEHAAE